MRVFKTVQQIGETVITTNRDDQRGKFTFDNEFTARQFAAAAREFREGAYMVLLQMGEYLNDLSKSDCGDGGFGTFAAQLYIGHSLQKVDDEIMRERVEGTR